VISLGSIKFLVLLMFKVGAALFIQGGRYAYCFFFSFFLGFLWFVLGTYPKQGPSYYPEKNDHG